MIFIYMLIPFICIDGTLWVVAKYSGYTKFEKITKAIWIALFAVLIALYYIKQS